MSLNKAKDYEKALQIYENHKRLMYSLARKVLLDHYLAEDVVTDCFFKIVKYIDKFKDPTSPQSRGLAAMMARNTAKNIRNRNSIYDEDSELEWFEDNSELISNQLEKAETYDTIVRAINSLPETYRDIAVLYFVDEFDYKEIAEITSVSYDTIRQRINRARKILQEMYELRQLKMG